ncbi:hypothetical protein PspLS_04157 [Pyricularia sp. CBS 133598]|nr:hypothetical protein PspLS_04157 [Pyricularia sp. CBS 133598]
MCGEIGFGPHMLLGTFPWLPHFNGRPPGRADRRREDVFVLANQERALHPLALKQWSRRDLSYGGDCFFLVRRA